jgi:multidrug efflux pump
VLVGGLSLGTLLTLFVVPVAYTLIASKLKVKSAPHDTAAAERPVKEGPALP